MFADENYERLYRSEDRLASVVSYFAILAVIIASLGLLALTSFLVERRKKEIGIRKVLGANVKHIVGLISKEFVLLIIIANVIALPLAYYLLQNWLQDFAYRVSLNLWLFMAAGIIALLVALFTISVQVIKAALSNPVKSIRYE